MYNVYEKGFHSAKLGRVVMPNEKEFKQLLMEEYEHRLKEMGKKVCNCMGCINDRKEYTEELEKLKSELAHQKETK